MRLRRELLERAVAVLAHVEVDLRDRVDAEALDEVDEQPELDAPALDERQHLEQRRAGPRTRRRAVARCRRASGTAATSNGPRHELGDAPAARRRAVERTRGSTPFTNTDVGVGEQRRDEPVDEVGRGSCAGRRRASRRCRRRTRRATSTARCPCPIPGPARAARRSSATHAGALPGRGLGGGVGRAVVDHDDLVDERRVLDQVAAHGGDDLADGRRLVAGREAHRDRGARACGVDQRATSDRGLPYAPGYVGPIAPNRAGRPA